MSLPVTFSGNQPLVAQLEAQVRSLIERGQLAPGTKVPSVRQLACDLGISTFTAVTAYDRLVAADYLIARRAAGHFVAKRRLDHLADPDLRGRTGRGGVRHPTIDAAANGNGNGNGDGNCNGNADGDGDGGGTGIDALWLFNALNTHPTAVKAGAGVLPAAWLGSDDVQRCARTALRHAAGSHADYPGPMGHRPLRDLLALKLIDLGISAQADQLVLTAGASHAMDLTVRTLLAPGDTVLVEDPGYAAVRAYLDAEGIAWAAVPRSTEGLDLDALERAIALHRPKALVVNSVLHNPTGGTLSTINAHRILNLAERHDLTIIEDDIYGDFHEGRAFRLANLDQLRRVVYIASVSKTVSASWRTGFIAAAAPLARRLAERKLLTCLATSELSERIVAELMASGVYRRHVERLRHRLATLLPTAAARLGSLGFGVEAEPEGGFFLWAQAPAGHSADALATAGLHHGLVLAPGSVFSASAACADHLRFNVAHCAGAEFVSRLAALLADRAAPPCAGQPPASPSPPDGPRAG